MLLLALTRVRIYRLHMKQSVCDQWVFDPQEIIALRRHGSTLSDWGFVYDIPSCTGSTAIQMKYVPRIVGVNLDQRHLRKLLKQVDAVNQDAVNCTNFKPTVFQVRLKLPI